MRKHEFLELLEENLTGNVPNNFRFIARSNGQWFEREVELGLEQIGIGIAFYTDAHRLSSVSLLKQFVEVERIMLVYYNNHKLHRHTLKSLDTVRYHNRELFGKPPIKIRDSKTASESIKKISTFINDDGLTFLEKFRDVNTLNLYLKNLSEKDVYNLLGGYDAWLRRMVIAFVCNDIEYFKKYDIYAKQMYYEHKDLNNLKKKYWNVFTQLSTDLNKQL